MWRSAVQVCLGLPGASSPLGGTVVYGGLAQLARAPALQAGGQRFESVILHIPCLLRTEIFDMLTHKTVSNEDIKLETEFCVFFTFG